MSALPVLLALATLTAAGGCGLDAKGEPPRPAERYTVERVVDGDTVELLSADGSTETVRVQGIDTPETHASRKLDRDVERSALDRETVRALGSEGVEVFRTWACASESVRVKEREAGDASASAMERDAEVVPMQPCETRSGESSPPSQASDHAAQLLPRARPVRVESDGRDRYGRLVGNRRSAPANIEAADEFGQPFDVGGRMIADGYAHAYDGGGRYPHPREDHYRALERQARDERAGLWAPASLSGGLDALSSP